MVRALLAAILTLALTIAGLTTPVAAQDPSGAPPPPSCPSGTYWDSASSQCMSASAPPPSSPYAPPPPSCPAGSYWDSSRSMCVSQESAPPTCQPDQYWDYQRQTCVASGSAYPSPPPSCQPDQYWDYQRQMCVAGGSYPSPPPSCQPDHYWDYQRQMCVVGGSYPSPPPSCQPGQYWDYQRQMCMAGDMSGGSYPSGSPPPYQDPCAEKFRTTGEQMEAIHRAVEERMRSFHEAFDRARAEYSATPHTGEEWRTFSDGWMQKGQALAEALRLEMEPKIKEILGECVDRISMGGPMPMFAPQAMFSPPPAGRPMPNLPPPPGAADERFQFNAEAERIRAECEAKARELMPRPPQNGTQAQPGMMPMDPAMETPMKALWRDCEERIRATFQAHAPMGEGDSFRDQRFGSFEMFMDPDTKQIVVQGRFVALKGVPEAQMMEKLTCAGALYVDRLFVNGLLEEFRPEETGQGTALRVYDAQKNRVIELHDNPRCVVNLAASGEIPSITLDLADHLDLERNEAGDLRFTAGGAEGLLLLHGAQVELGDGNKIVITGKATFLLKAENADPMLGSRYEDAIAKKRVGAEVRIAADGSGVAVDSTPMGDLDINVTGAKDKVTAIIDSPSGAGKTVVLELDAALFGSRDVLVHVVGVDANGAQTMLTVQEAEDMTDVLDPTDDGSETVEYWIIQDKKGFHVLVSFPHFSEKRVTIESASTDAVAAPFIPGFEAGLVALGVVSAIGFTAFRMRKLRP